MASEAFALSVEERRAILEDVDAVAPGLPVAAGIGATGLASALEQLRGIADSTVGTAMVLPPYLVKPSGDQIVDFYAAVAMEAVRHGMTIMVQDAPGAAGVAMPPELLGRLSRLDGVTSIKVEAPPTVMKMAALAGVLDDTTTMYGGQNAQFVLDEYACGAVGTMPACEFTDVLAPILATWNSGDRVVAREEFAKLMPLIVWGLQSGPAWHVHKHVLVRRGLIGNAAVRPPAQRLAPVLEALLDEVVDGVQLAAVDA
jgi:4-hydroxy-tetrahydrodipicolinate synthase